MSDFLSFDTLSLHAGQTLDSEFGSRAQPIHQTTSYVFTDTDTASSLFNLERGGHVYNRISNPTVGVLEQRVAALEGGSAAVCVASGMSAVFCALTALVSQGDHVVASANMYGGNISLLKNTLPRFGITATFVDPTDIKEIELERDNLIKFLTSKDEAHDTVSTLCKNYEKLCKEKYPEAPLPLGILDNKH